MTLVYVAKNLHVPFLIGDMLVSGPGSEHATIPTFADLDSLSFPNASLKVVGLANKLVILRPNLALGWAGNRWYATAAIRHLNETLSSSPTLAELEEVLREYDEKSRGVVLIGALVAEDGNSCFRWDDVSGSFAIGHSFKDGSGETTLQRNFLDKPFQRGFKVPGGEITDRVEATIGQALQVVGTFMGEEIASGGYLDQYFGGGYDVIF